MKYIILCASLFLLIFGSNSAFAAKGYDWSQTQIKAVYEEVNETLVIFWRVPYRDMNLENYSLWINIAGESYRKFFKYDETYKEMVVRFDISQTNLKEKYPYSFSVKDALFYEIYTDEWTIIFSSIKSTYPSKNTNINTKNTSSHTSNKVEYKDTFFDGKISRTGYEIWKKNTQNATRSTNRGKNNNPYYVDYKKYAPKKKYSKKTYGRFIPKYKKPSEEPKSINGIGNNPRYNSWRR